jgi:hypothetical protein
VEAAARMCQLVSHIAPDEALDASEPCFGSMCNKVQRVSDITDLYAETETRR